MLISGRESPASNFRFFIPAACNFRFFIPAACSVAHSYLGESRTKTRARSHRVMDPGSLLIFCLLEQDWKDTIVKQDQSHENQSEWKHVMTFPFFFLFFR
ncbi:hypothetical protein AHAS_Ahas08G0035000 [Arachis hypogaea]